MAHDTPWHLIIYDGSHHPFRFPFGSRSVGLDDFHGPCRSDGLPIEAGLVQSASGLYLPADVVYELEGHPTEWDDDIFEDDIPDTPLDEWLTGLDALLKEIDTDESI